MGKSLGFGKWMEIDGDRWGNGWKRAEFGPFSTAVGLRAGDGTGAGRFAQADGPHEHGREEDGDLLLTWINRNAKVSTI